VCVCVCRWLAVIDLMLPQRNPRNIWWRSCSFFIF